MKKIIVLFLLLVFLLCISLCFCACETFKNHDQTSTNYANSPIESTSPSESAPSTTSSTPSHIITFESVAEPFRSILEDKQTFYSATKKENVKISSYNRDMLQYTAVDFDSDDVDEFAIMLQDGDIVILRKNGDSVVGFNFGVRSIYQINKDGTYAWNENSGNIYGCSKLEFSQNDCKSVELFRVERGENDSISYYVNGKFVPENEYKAALAKISTESISWTSLK